MGTGQRLRDITHIPGRVNQWTSVSVRQIQRPSPIRRNLSPTHVAAESEEQRKWNIQVNLFIDSQKLLNIYYFLWETFVHPNIFFGGFLACLIKQSFMIKISIASIFLKFRFPIFKKNIFLIWIENINTNHNNICNINPKRFLATPYPIGWQGIWGRWASVSLSLYACSEDKRWDKSTYYARKIVRSIAWSHAFIILRKHVIPVAG